MNTVAYQPLIMVVDDDWINRELMQTMLQKVGYRTMTSGTGTEALKEIPVLQPDLILLDVRLTDMNGFEVCSRIKQDPSTKNIPVIMLSALDLESMEEVQAAGADEFISKLITLPKLISHLEAYLPKP